MFAEKRSWLVLCALVLILLAPGCAGHEVRERGWLGGECVGVRDSFFRPDPLNGDPTLPVLPADVRDKQTGAVLVVRAGEDTPLGLAGVLPGDLLLAANGAPLDSVEDLRERVLALRPGQTLDLELRRDGTNLIMPVRLGRERYEMGGLLSLGLRLSPRVSLGFDPDFNLLGLVSYRRDDRPVELAAPEEKYLAANSGDGKFPARTRWEVWLGVIGLGRTELVRSQEALVGASGPDLGVKEGS